MTAAVYVLVWVLVCAVICTANHKASRRVSVHDVTVTPDPRISPDVAIDVATRAIIDAIRDGRDPIAVQVLWHPSGPVADVVCAGDAVAGAEALLRRST